MKENTFYRPEDIVLIPKKYWFNYRDIKRIVKCLNRSDPRYYFLTKLNGAEGAHWYSHVLTLIARKIT